MNDAQGITAFETRTIERPNRSTLTEFVGKPEPAIMKDDREEIQTASAILSVIRVLVDLPDEQTAIIFQSVQAIRKAARRDLNETIRIGAEISLIEREKAARKRTKRRWWGRSA